MCVVNKDFSALKNDFNGPSENNFCSGLQFLTKRKKKNFNFISKFNRDRDEFSKALQA